MDKSKAILFFSCFFISHTIQAMDPSQIIFHLIRATSPLAYTTRYGQYTLEVLQQWLAHHPQDIHNVCHINDMSITGTTPLICAILHLNILAALLLLTIPGININARDTTGRTALHWAAGTEIIDLNDNIFEPQDNTSPSKYLNQQLHYLIEQLIDKRALVNIKDNQGCTPLALASMGTRPLLEHLIQQSNNRLLLTGACRGDWRAVQLAMRDGADIDTQDTRPSTLGNTPLYQALIFAIQQINQNEQAKPAMFNFVRLLLSYNPSTYISNQYDSNAFQLASSKPELLRLLLETQQIRMQHLHSDDRYRK